MRNQQKKLVEPAREHPSSKLVEPAREHPSSKPVEPARERPSSKPVEPAREHPSSKLVEPARERQRTAESKPPLAPGSQARTPRHGFGTTSLRSEQAGPTSV